MRRSTLIPAVLAILVLNACAQRESASLPTGGVLPMPVAQGNIWKAVAPFVAGRYAGGCARIPEMDIGDATIEVGLDGKLTAPGTGIGLRQQRLVSLTRKTKDGVLTVAAMLTTHGEPGATLNLLDAGKPEGAAATLMNADHELDCPHGAPLLKLRSQPLYKSLARWFASTERVLKCITGL